MGVRILHDSESNQAALYCSTSDFAFGPIFNDGDDGEHYANDRAEAFLRWLDYAPNWREYDKETPLIISVRRRDARELTQRGIEMAYHDWLAQESRQYQRERLDYLVKYGEDNLEPEEIAEIASLRTVLGIE